MQIIFPKGLDSYLQTKQNIFSVTKFKREIKIQQEKTYVQVIIAQWLALGLATGEVPGSNLGKGENLLISD